MTVNFTSRNLKVNILMTLLFSSVFQTVVHKQWAVKSMWWTLTIRWYRTESGSRCLRATESACSAGDARDASLIPGWEIPWRRKWQPTPVFLLGESHGWRSLAGYSPWGRKESVRHNWMTKHRNTQNRKY